MLDDSKVLKIYNRVKKDAFEAFRAGNIIQTLKYISLSAKWAYNYNFIFCDPEIDTLLIENAKKIEEEISYIPLKDRILLFDTCGRDNRGLIQQYVRALIKNDYEFTLIYLDSSEYIQETINEIQESVGGNVLLFHREENELLRIEKILKYAREFKPSQILLDISPWDVVSLSSCALIKNATIFNINGTDHAFWLGTSIIDFNLEFRVFGWTLSKEKRGLNENQLILFPYYPITPPKIPLETLPSFSKGTVKILTGGAYYKYFGREDFFFKMIDRILEVVPNAVLLVAGSGDSLKMNCCISRMEHRNQVFLIGNRKDLNELFKYCDIYLNSYPTGGGLMCQQAAMNKKPILSLQDEYNKAISYIDEVISPDGSFVFSHSNVEDLIVYAEKLCRDGDYRLAEGEKLNGYIVTIDAFNNRLKLILEKSNIKTEPLCLDKIDYLGLKNLYLEIENKYTQAGLKMLISVYRLNVFLKFPYLLFPIGYITTKYLKRKIKL